MNVSKVSVSIGMKVFPRGKYEPFEAHVGIEVDLAPGEDHETASKWAHGLVQKNLDFVLVNEVARLFGPEAAKACLPPSQIEGFENKE